MGENIAGTGRYRIDNYRSIIQLVNYTPVSAFVSPVNSGFLITAVHMGDSSYFWHDYSSKGV